MLAMLMTASCTDSDYDLSDIDTTTKFKITDVTLPLNVKPFTMDADASNVYNDFESMPQIQQDMLLQQNPSIDWKYSNEWDINMGDDFANLTIENGVIRGTVENTFSAPLLVKFTLYGEDNKNMHAELTVPASATTNVELNLTGPIKDIKKYSVSAETVDAHLSNVIDGRKIKQVHISNLKANISGYYQDEL